MGQFFLAPVFPNNKSKNLLTKYENQSYCFPYYFHTGNKKAPSVSAKCLKSLKILVGDASFELATPAV